MAVRIRMKRMGRRNRPFYRIGAFDSRTPRDGKAIELLGTYDPLNTDLDQQIAVTGERMVYWLQQGAKPSDTVGSFLKKLKISKAGAPQEAVKLSDVIKDDTATEAPADEPKPVETADEAPAAEEAKAE